MLSSACDALGTPKRVCSGLTNLVLAGWPELKKFHLVPDFFCEEVMPYCDTNLYTPLKDSDYVDKVMKDKPAHIKNDDFIQKTYEAIGKDTKKRETFKVVHLADAHYDLKYAVGANRNCDEMNIVCCRADVGFPTDPND